MLTSYASICLRTASAADAGVKAARLVAEISLRNFPRSTAHRNRGFHDRADELAENDCHNAGKGGRDG
jgi:hypothetical protein